MVLAARGAYHWITTGPRAVGQAGHQGRATRQGRGRATRQGRGRAPGQGRGRAPGQGSRAWQPGRAPVHYVEVGGFEGHENPNVGHLRENILLGSQSS
jgi:hypothetical protein